MRPNLTFLLLLSVALLLPPASVNAAQVCTIQRVGTDEFRGISGTSDADVIAVGKKGTIYRYDGTSWNSMPSATGEDLNDVSAVDSTAFAVGKDGVIVQLVSGSWISYGEVVDEDLAGVWAASATEAWAAGKNGTITAFDGVSWTDQSAAAGTIPDDLTDIWGDADSVYVISEKGDLYRYDRTSSTWMPRDTSCTSGDKFEDLWGDGNGNIFLVGKKDVYLYDGSSCTVMATADEDLFGVSGWTQDGSVVAVGKKGTIFEYDGSSWTETQVGNKELQDDWVSPTGNAYFAGKNKELTVCECVDCPSSGLPQFIVTHDSYGINCQAEAVQLQVIDSTTGTPMNNYDAPVTLDTQSGFGSWSLVAGSGTFNDATLNDGLATYDWPLGETTVAFTLSYPEGPPSIDVDVYQSSDPGIRDNDAEGQLLFSPNGFTLTANPLGNPPPAVIPVFSAAQIAGTDFPIYITAFGQTPNDPVCGVIESYTGPKDLKFWFDHVNPGSGSIAPTIDANGIPAVEASAANQPVAFTNGQAAVTGKYKDVGRIQVSVKDDSQPHPDLPNGIRGATAGLVVRPYQFALSNIEDGAGSPNPAAVDANGGAFVAAGETFSITVSALDAEGDITPNYGQESIAETVALTTTLVAPLAGDNPPLAGGFGAFVNGQASGTNFNWPEVGIITLTPSVGDGDYLGAGDVAGAASGNVGRFYAHHFTTALNTPTFATSCASGSFTYIGEVFNYSNAPVITTTARALAGEIAENYAGGFFKIDSSSLTAPLYTSTPATLDTGGLPAGDPIIAETGAGTGTLTFGSGTGLFYTRGTEEAPFDADIRLSIDVADSDGAAATNPVEFGTAGGILFDSGAEMRYGRGRLLNAYGSELVNLTVPFRTEYFVNAATGFVPNVDDSCTAPVSLSFVAFTDNLAAGETCVFDTGAPGSSGAGCAAPGPLALRYRAPPLGGDFNLHLQAPGDTNDGSTTIRADVPDWLEFDWDSASPGLEDPVGTAVFGIFSGSDRRIYIRELY
ncbi:MAG: hypothetical protein KJO09_15210 [Gammaproteobacteria bacterium]|nr:hypothetical protein [Gammaproteobacteria bacterium]